MAAHAYTIEEYRDGPASYYRVLRDGRPCDCPVYQDRGRAEECISRQRRHDHSAEMLHAPERLAEGFDRPGAIPPGLKLDVLRLIAGCHGR